MSSPTIPPLFFLDEPPPEGTRILGVSEYRGRGTSPMLAISFQMKTLGVGWELDGQDVYDAIVDLSRKRLKGQDLYWMLDWKLGVFTVLATELRRIPGAAAERARRRASMDNAVGVQGPAENPPDHGAAEGELGA